MKKRIDIYKYKGESVEIGDVFTVADIARREKDFEVAVIERVEDIKPCIWKQDNGYDDDGSWNTSCGEMFVFIDDTPKGNGMKFCCYCGSRLIEELYQPEPENEE